MKLILMSELWSLFYFFFTFINQSATILWTIHSTSRFSKETICLDDQVSMLHLNMASSFSILCSLIHYKNKQSTYFFLLNIILLIYKTKGKKYKNLTCVSICIKAVRSTKKFLKRKEKYYWLLTTWKLTFNIQGLDRNAIFNGILYKKNKSFPPSMKNKLLIITFNKHKSTWKKSELLTCLKNFPKNTHQERI